MPEVYKIGIEIALAGTIRQGLEAISAGLLGIKTKVADVEGGFARWGTAILGVSSMFAGSALFAGLNKLSDKGEELLHQQALMKTQGWSLTDMQNALNAAWKTSADIMTTIPSENLKHLADIAYATGGMSSAIDILPQLAKSNAILNSIKGGGTDEVFNLVKALEQKGLATPENRDQFESYVNMMTKVVESTHGRVTPQMFQRAFVYGRTAMLGWDEQFITEIMPRLIQSMAVGGGAGGGSGTTGPGNALMSAFAKVVQGQMPMTAADMLHDFGLADNVKHIKGSAESQIKVRGAALFGKDPYEWVQTYLVPALKAHGIDMNDSVKVGQAIAQMFPVRTASSVISEMALQGRAALGTEASPFEKDRRLTLQSQGIGTAFAGLGENDPFTIWAKFTAQLNAFGEAMAPLAQMKLDWIKDLTPFVGSLSQLAAANPAAIKTIAAALGGLAIGLTVLGTGAVLAAAMALAPNAAIAAAVIGIGSVISALAAMNWEGVKNALHGVVDAFNAFINAIVGLGARVEGAIRNIIPGGSSSPSVLPPGAHGGFPSPGAPSVRPGMIAPGKQSEADTPVHIKTAVYLDGRIIGETISSELASLSTFPRQAPYSDTYLGWAAPDYNFGTG